MKKLITIVLLGCALCVQASRWKTHFAYNNVTQIAMAEDKVYALSDGSIFSVEKETEKMEVYDRLSGLSSTGIVCIHYDTPRKQLIIAYGGGKIDLLTSKGVHYISELYDKDMTQRKTIYNVTIVGYTAYLSTHYGVQTMDLRDGKLVDSYWLRPNAQETPILDVLIANDSIYAFAADSMFCAALRDNLVDYTYWKRERYGRITPDLEKGKHYQDATSEWYAGGEEGIVRYTATERLSYLPNGPLSNTMYRMSGIGTKLGVVPGGYSISSIKRPGQIMIYNFGNWTNYSQEYMISHIGMNSTVYSDIIFDPDDDTHFFVSSFGYGLFEFRQDTFYAHYNHTNSAIESVLDPPVYPYIWVDGLQFDTDGNLWMTNISSNVVKVLRPDGHWISISNDACKSMDRSKDLLISVTNPNIKIISSVRNGIGVFDDNGTIEDPSDDRAVLCNSWQNEMGNLINMPRISSFAQTKTGALLVGTEVGLYYINNPEELLNGSNVCSYVDVSIPEEGRYNIFESENIRSITLDTSSHIWVGTQYSGFYCLSPDLSQVLDHFSTENSPIPTNDVLSLYWMEDTRHLFIGTSEGLVEFAPDELPEGIEETSEKSNQSDIGSMQQWRLHLSYANPQQIASSPSQIFAVANGSLFSVDRSTNEINYWSKETGLTGTTIAHIAYDASTSKLIIAYENGLIDILDNNGNVKQMPDITMKSGSIASTFNSLCVGSKYVYAAMPFGIIAIDSRKAEVSDTYYIGEDGASIDVQHVVELGDTLYAFSYGKMYKAALQDNLVDYAFWKSETLPFEQVDQVVAYKNSIYLLSENILYKRVSGTWETVISTPLEWIHASEAQLLTYQQNVGLMQLDDDGNLKGISNQYVATDALYSNGEYWLAEKGKGVVHLQTSGDEIFIPAGPLSNFGYHLDIAHDRVYVSPGGRWATMFGRMSDLSIYDGQEWLGIPNSDTWYYTDHPIRDAVQYAVDPNDPGHFFVATYGTGVFEFKDYKGFKHFDSSNSTLRKAASDVSDRYFTCTDGAIMDEEGNLWVLNSTALGNPVHIMKPNGTWYSIPLKYAGQNLRLNTPRGTWIDRRNNHWKWLMSQRSETRLFLLDDGGTPTYSGDDKCIARSSFIDQNGNIITPANFRCFSQDYTNRIWIGTDKGIITIPSSVDFFISDACRRIIIPRNDGTGLGDYLLGDEQINCLAVDGGNRIWIGTENSGLYLIEDDTITVAHFTETNSLLPSNSVQSIAIMSKTGEVFVGTSRGIASYRSDASEARQDLSSAYAFPNPVRQNYSGMISIAGLMENTVVNIIDAGGNLICKTRSHGGMAVWDGKLPDGRRATAGVYTALCNAEGGHTVVKILVIR